MGHDKAGRRYFSNSAIFALGYHKNALWIPLIRQPASAQLSQSLCDEIVAPRPRAIRPSASWARRSGYPAFPRLQIRKPRQVLRQQISLHYGLLSNCDRQTSPKTGSSQPDPARRCQTKSEQTNCGCANERARCLQLKNTNGQVHVRSRHCAAD